MAWKYYSYKQKLIAGSSGQNSTVVSLAVSWHAGFFAKVIKKGWMAIGLAITGQL